MFGDQDRQIIQSHRCCRLYGDGRRRWLAVDVGDSYVPGNFGRGTLAVGDFCRDRDCPRRIVAGDGVVERGIRRAERVAAGGDAGVGLHSSPTVDTPGD